MALIFLILIIVGIEIVLTGVFYFMAGKLDWKSLIKGLIERAFLVIALLYGYPHALTVFSALKLGTRLKRNDKEEGEEINLRGRFHFNDFYLIGNFLSVMAAIIYVQLLKR